MSRNANTHGRFLNGSIQALVGAIVLSTPLTTAAQSSNAQPHCIQVGGTVMTNFLDANTTLGTATGDLSGAVSATLLGASPGSNGTLVFSVQHHWVTAAGDTILTQFLRRPYAPPIPCPRDCPAQCTFLHCPRRHRHSP